MTQKSLRTSSTTADGETIASEPGATPTPALRIAEHQHGQNLFWDDVPPFY